MTTYNKSSLATFFETGDVPTGADYSNLIDSCVNVAETSVQAMQGPLNPTELITPRVSATNGAFTGTLRVDGIFSAANVILSNLSANSINTGAINASSAVIVGSVSAGSLKVDADVSADASIYASAFRGLFLNTTGIVSAAGTSQGTAAALAFVINTLKGVTDGTATGFAIPANRTGAVTYVANRTASSANLWPPSGGTINGLSVNAAFGLTAGSSYMITHDSATAFSVK